MRYTRQLLYSRDTQKLELLTTPLNRLGVRLKGSFWEEAIRTVRGDGLVDVGLLRALGCEIARRLDREIDRSV